VFYKAKRGRILFIILRQK